jgi:hypothetical protein
MIEIRSKLVEAMKATVLTAQTMFFLAVLFSFTGCGEAPKTNKAITEGGYEELNPEVKLPKGADIIEDLGNGWILFRLEVLGEERYFMLRDAHDTSGDGRWAIQPFTEVAPPRK